MSSVYTGLYRKLIFCHRLIDADTGSFSFHKILIKKEKPVSLCTKNVFNLNYNEVSSRTGSDLRHIISKYI